MLGEAVESSRQWLLYPQEFRIALPRYMKLSESPGDLAISQEPLTDESQSAYRDEEELLDMAVDVGTLVWRVRKRLSAMDQLPKELNRVSRDLESAWDALAQRGVEIRDHTGQDYVSGMALKVIASQPVTGLTKRQVIETLKPTVYYKDRVVQMGDVVIGFPPDNRTSELAEEGP